MEVVPDNDIKNPQSNAQAQIPAACRSVSVDNTPVETKAQANDTAVATVAVAGTLPSLSQQQQQARPPPPTALKQTGSSTTTTSSVTTASSASLSPVVSTDSQPIGSGSLSSNGPGSQAAPKSLSRTSRSSRTIGKQQQIGTGTGTGIGSEATPTSSSSGRASTRQTHTAFIHKLYQMLEDSNMAHLIWWSKSADSFVIVPSEEFAKALSSYFKHANISSFVRQLNMYGFHKVNESSPGYQADSSQWEFRHGQGSFKRGDINALRDIKRRTSSKNVPSASLLAHAQSSLPPSMMAGANQPGASSGQHNARTTMAPVQSYSASGVSSSTSLTSNTHSHTPSALGTLSSKSTPSMANLSLKSIPTITSSSSSSGSLAQFMSGPRTSYFSNLPHLAEGAPVDPLAGANSAAPAPASAHPKFPPLLPPKDEAHMYGGATPSMVQPPPLQPPPPASGQVGGQHSGNISHLGGPREADSEERLVQLENAIWSLREANQSLQRKSSTICDVLRKTNADLSRILDLLLGQLSPTSGIDNATGQHGDSGANSGPLDNIGPLLDGLSPSAQNTITQIRQNMYATSLMLSYLDDGPSASSAGPVASSSAGNTVLGTFTPKNNPISQPFYEQHAHKRQHSQSGGLPGQQQPTAHQGYPHQPSPLAQSQPQSQSLVQQQQPSPPRPLLSASSQDSSNGGVPTLPPPPAPSQHRTSTSLPAIHQQQGREHRLASYPMTHTFVQSAPAHLPLSHTVNNSSSAIQVAGDPHATTSHGAQSGSVSTIPAARAAAGPELGTSSASAPVLISGSVQSLLNPTTDATSQLSNKRPRNG